MVQDTFSRAHIFENTILNLKQDMSPLHFELPRGQEALLEDYAPYYRRARTHTHTHTHTLPLSLSFSPVLKNMVSGHLECDKINETNE